MTDLELVEAAAQAAAIHLHAAGWNSEKHLIVQDGRAIPWNPLTDDGDALRLAVTIGISVEYLEGGVWAFTDEDEPREFVKYEGDKFAATRRAIVYAAVALATSDGNQK